MALHFVLYLKSKLRLGVRHKRDPTILRSVTHYYQCTPTVAYVVVCLLHAGAVASDGWDTQGRLPTRFRLRFEHSLLAQRNGRRTKNLWW